jgi:hypothetical protein
MPINTLDIFGARYALLRLRLCRSCLLRCYVPPSSLRTHLPSFMERLAWPGSTPGRRHMTGEHRSRLLKTLNFLVDALRETERGTDGWFFAVH